MVLILRQIDYGRDRMSCVHLVRKLAHKIQGFGEDRAHSGLLGAIGLGKKSALSEKYVTCFCFFFARDDSQGALRFAPVCTFVCLSVHPSVRLFVTLYGIEFV